MRVLRDERLVATSRCHKGTTSYETTRSSYAALWGLSSGRELVVSRRFKETPADFRAEAALQMRQDAYG